MPTTSSDVATGRFDGVPQRVLSDVWLPFLFLVFGVAQLVPGGAAVRQSIELSRHGLHSEGVVEAVRHHEPSCCYNGTCNDWTEVTVSSTDAHGVARRVSRSGARSTRVGDRVHVTYERVSPTPLRRRAVPGRHPAAFSSPPLDE